MGTRFPEKPQPVVEEPKESIPFDPSHLTLLGNKNVPYTYKDPNSEILEVFKSPSNREYAVSHTTSEFTSLCPKTGQPDYAELQITFTPNELCVETKSLKLYLVSFRNYGCFMEGICNRIADDLIAVMKPKYLTVDMTFKDRGGIKTRVVRDYAAADALSADETVA